MIFTQHYLACLSHASYLVGDETTGRAVVVDPRRDVGVYLEEAAAAGLTIERVIETHVHADFLSGHLELAAQTGAVISYGAGADVEFPIEPLDDGQRLSLGDVTLEILATPGHTPESICIVVYEHADDAVPYGVLTGDTLFVGDVGRPDLLASAGADLSADVLARQLYHSLHDKLLRLLPDATRVFPAHGAGSSCGKQLSSETSSTIGEQRRTNYALQPMDEDEFVAAVTEGQPLRPQLLRVRRPAQPRAAPAARRGAAAAAHDRRGRPAGTRRERCCSTPASPPTSPPGTCAARSTSGSRVASPNGPATCWRPTATSCSSAIRRSPSKPRSASARVGYDRVVGQLDDPAVVFTSRPDLIETSSRLTIEQLAELRGLEPGLQLVDVRSPGETAGRHAARCT